MSTPQWANIGDDPGALHALIARIPEYLPVPLVDYLWLFPPRRIAVGESTVVVIGAFDVDPDRRRVSTAHFTVARNRKGAATVNARFDEHGSAPVAAVPRIVQGVLRRLGEDTEASPREEQIAGVQERWHALIVELGGAVPEDAVPGRDEGESADRGAETAAARAADADGAGIGENLVAEAPDDAPQSPAGNQDPRHVDSHDPPA